MKPFERIRPRVRPTAREAWLLSWCIKAPRSMLRMSPTGGWSLVRLHVMHRHDYEPEGLPLIKNGWVTLRPDPAPRSSDETWPAFRAVITPKGRAALDEFMNV